MVEVKPKRQKVSTQPNMDQPQLAVTSSGHVSSDPESKDDSRKEQTSSTPKHAEGETRVDNPVKSLLGLAYASSDDEEDDD